MVWEDLKLLLALVPVEEILPFSRKFWNAEYYSCILCKWWQAVDFALGAYIKMLSVLNVTWCWQ